MELEKTKHEMKLMQWRELVAECRSSGKRVKDWCTERGICEQSYYRWQRQVWDTGVQQTGLESRPENAAIFAEYVSASTLPPSTTAVVLELNCGRVEIQNGADRDTIEHTLRILQSLC